MDFSRRSLQEELMDTEPVTYEQFEDCLRELETINQWAFAYPPTLRWLRKILRDTQKNNLSILDIGSGGADMLRHIWKRFGKPYKDMVLTGVDINPFSKKAADIFSKDLPIHNETSDIFTFDSARQADVIISSLFTHHLSDEQLVRFLQWMEQHSTIGWFINDLHRHTIPYYVIKIATRLFSRNHLIKHDGPVSVSRAFTRTDWQRLLQMAGIPIKQTRIRWCMPFRYCVERRK